MINQKKRLLNTLNRKLLTGIFVFCLAVFAGIIGCSDSGGGSSKTGYHLTGYEALSARHPALSNPFLPPSAMKISNFMRNSPGL